MEDFKKELTTLINRYSLENGSNTPDFILAGYLLECLETVEQLLETRDKWYGDAEAEAKVEITKGE